ncbi:MAG: type I methionyl aminopeptidase [Candidatus Saccharimonadales bacterium]
MHPKTDKEIKAIRQSGRILNEVFAATRRELKSGMTTQELAAVVRREIAARDAEPVLLGYHGFPDVVCISVNQQVVHGIPGAYQLQADDLVSLDLCVGYQGMITDSAFTTVVGGVDKASSRVRRGLRATEEALFAGIEQVRPGVHIGDISQAIQRRLLRDGLGVVEDLVGHGVGHAVHEDPEIPNYGRAGAGPTLKSGMTVAIEPMATLGGKEVQLESDGWTISTQDRSLSMHFEHTVLVTPTGYEVLTG